MKRLLMAVAAASLLTACASSKLATSQIESAAIKQASEAKITPEQAIENARNALIKANSDDLSYYTPLHFKDAQASLEKIETLQKDKSAVQGENINLAIITEAFKTQELINKAYQAKETIENTLSGSLNHKKVLDELGCKNAFPKAYNNIEEDLIDLFKLIEQNKVEKARQDEADLLADMTELEIDSLIKSYVTPAIFILDKAEDYDADDYAEKTFEKAELAIERAKEFIKVNYRKRDEVKRVGFEAVIAAKKALNTGKLSKSMVELDEESAELKALEMVDLLDTVIQAFGAENLQGLSLQEQAQELAKLARLQTSKIKELNEQQSIEQAVNDVDNKHTVTLLGVNEVVVDEVADEAPSEVVVDAIANEVVADEVTDEAVVDEVTDEAVIDEVTDEAVIDEVTDEAVIDEVTDEVVIDEVISEDTVKEVTNEENATL